MNTATGLWILVLLPLCSPMQRSSDGGGSPFIINPDGSYQFSYDTQTGGFHSEQRSADGAVAGKYGFTGDGGGKLNVQYTAAAGKGEVGGGPAYEEHHTTSHHQPQTSSSGGGGGVGGGDGSYSLSLKPDGTYSYEYSLSDQSKMESRGPDGRVKGQFSYTDKDGQKKSITYTADERGFLPEGDHIPKASAEFYEAHQKAAGSTSSFGGQSNTYHQGGSSSYGSNFGSYGHQGGSSSHGSDFGSYGHQGGSSSHGSDFGSYGHQGGSSSHGSDFGSYGHQGGSSSHGSDFGSHGHQGGATGNTYSFDYKTPGQMHSQSFSGGAVSGQYSVNSDGASQKVSYSANGKKGYNPTVDTSAQIGHGGSSNSWKDDSGLSGGYKMAEDSGSGGTWSYQYNAGAHDHQEMGSNGQVQGQYNVKSMGGNQQTTYTAGKGGFMPTHNINIKVGATGRPTGMMQGYGMGD